jgi:hypothetical protein
MKLLYKLCLFFFLDVNFSSLLIMDNSYSQQMEVTIAHSDPWKDYIPAIATLGAVVVGAILTNYLGPHIKEKFRLREVYFVPYKKWCTGLYGEVQEYQTILKMLKEENLNEKTITGNTHFNKKISDDYLITHFWEIHKAIASGHTWLGKIHTDTYKQKTGILDKDKKIIDKDKNETNLYQYFDEFISYIDYSWHDFENTYSELIEADFQEGNFRKKLGILVIKNKKNGRDILNEMSNLIKDKYLKNNPIGEDKLEEMKIYLEKQIT